MKRLLPLLVLVPSLALSAVTATVTPGDWALYRGTSIASRHVTEAACVDAAKALNVARSYTCRTSTGVTVTVTVDPPPPPPPVEPPPPPSGGLLQPSDITFLGSFDLYTDGRDSTYTQSIAVRRVSGQTRLMVHHLRGRVVEVSADVPYGATASTILRSWDVSPYLDWYHKSIWWDGSRLWAVNSAGYTVSDSPARVYAMTLNDNGTLSDVRGPFGLEGVSSKRTRSGVVAIPQGFQTAHGVGPYAIGLGGYTSLMAQGGSAAMGASLYAIPDPSQIAGVTVPASSFKALAARGNDPRGRRIWYGFDHTAGATGDGGKGPVNYFDSGDPRQNPSSRPTIPPVSGAGYQSPTAQGDAQWVWGDRYVGAFWIDTPTKRGLVMIGDFGTGKAWYQSSSLAWDHRTFEAHIFDPAHLAEVVAGTRSASDVEPVIMASLPQADTKGVSTEYGYGRSASAAYEPETRRLYVYKAAMSDAYTGRVYVYQIAD